MPLHSLTAWASLAGCVVAACGGSSAPSDAFEPAADGPPILQSEIFGEASGPTNAVCLPRLLEQYPDPNGNLNAQCIVQIAIPGGAAACDATRGQHADTIGLSPSTPTPEGAYTLCDVAEVPTDVTSGMPADSTMVGWYYASQFANGTSTCTAQLGFIGTAAPLASESITYQCIESISNE